jgi:2',3'-cyclic-nucleotide 2'-phosphodiesterase (5'-nucleotidase family)
LLPLAAVAALVLMTLDVGASEDPTKGETALGDFVADAVRSAAQADVALIQAAIFAPQGSPGSQGKPGEARPVTPSEQSIRSVLAYADDPVAVMTLEGRKLLQALERSLSLVPQPNKGFLQVSGLTVEFNPSAPAGRRIVRVTVSLAASGVKSPLEASRSYKVAAPLSLAKGAVGYFRVFDGVPVKPTDVTLLRAVMSHLSGARIPAKPEGRIREAK